MVLPLARVWLSKLAGNRIAPRPSDGRSPVERFLLAASEAAPSVEEASRGGPAPRGSPGRGRGRPLQAPRELPNSHPASPTGLQAVGHLKEKMMGRESQSAKLWTGSIATHKKLPNGWQLPMVERGGGMSALHAEFGGGWRPDSPSIHNPDGGVSMWWPIKMQNEVKSDLEANFTNRTATTFKQVTCSLLLLSSFN